MLLFRHARRALTHREVFSLRLAAVGFGTLIPFYVDSSLKYLF